MRFVLFHTLAATAWERPGQSVLLLLNAVGMAVITVLLLRCSDSMQSMQYPVHDFKKTAPQQLSQT